jgi:protein tyrosine phosphatase
MPRKTKVPKELSKAVVEKKAVPKEKVEKKKAVPKAKVEKKKAVPKEKVEKKKAVPKEKVEKKKAVPKEKVEKKKAVPKEKVEKNKAVPKEKVEKKKAVPKEKVEKKKAVPKEKVEKKKAVPKEKVEKKKVSKGGIGDTPTHSAEGMFLSNFKLLGEATATKAAPAAAKTAEEAQAEMVKTELIDILKKEPIKSKKEPIKSKKEIYDELIKRLEELKTSGEQSKEEIKTAGEQSKEFKILEKDIQIYDELIKALELKKSSLTQDKGIDDRINSFKISDEEINDATTPEKLESYLKEIKISDVKIIDATTPNVSAENKLSFNDINEENRGIKEGDEKNYYSDTTILQYEKVLQNNIDAFLQAKKGGGKKNIKHVRKAKYGKKYKGGMSEKLNKIAIMVKQRLKETVFGITLDLDDPTIKQIEEECKKYRVELEKKSNEIIRGLQDPNQKKIVEQFFRYVLTEEEDNGKNSVVKAFHAKRKLDYATGDQIKEYRKKIYDSSNTLNSIQYVDSYIFNKLYRPNINCNVYGMQLPHQFDRVKLLGTMYKLHKSGIYSIVDLQDCNSGINGGHPMITKGVGCNLFDRNCEIDMWALAIATSDVSPPPNNAKYYGIEYADMSAGTLRTWNAISTIKNIKGENNKLVVHCLAGAGRTGSVILYLLMRDSQPKESNSIKEDISKLYFGCDSIPKFIETKLLPYFTVVDDDVLIDNRYFIKHMIAELFELGEKKDDIDRIILFRKRLNFIIVFLAREFDITEFVTYHHTDFGKKPEDFSKSLKKTSKITLDPDTYDKENILLTVQFCQAYTVKIDKWTDYNIDNILSDSKDPRYGEVMNWIE